MGFKLDNNALLYVFIVILLATIAMSIKFKIGAIFKVCFRIILGGLFIYAFNFIGKNFNITIPLNIVTVIITGLLEIPGVALIFVMKYILFP